MTTSGTTSFNPSLGEITLNAFGRIQVRRAEIIQQHLADAQTEANLLLAKFNNLQPNLWTVDLQSSVLIQGTSVYTVPDDTALILDAYIRYGPSSNTDRIITPISRTEYASYSNKTSQGFPSVFWFDRLTSPTLTLWKVPDGNTYTLFYYRVRRIQDSILAGGSTVEVPFLWLDAYTAALAHRLARIYAPQLEQIRKSDADEAWLLAANQDVENVNLYIAPGLAGYWR